MVAAFYSQTNIFRNKPISDGKNSKTAWVAVIVLLLCSFSIRAQHRYQTREGMMEVIGSYRDSIVVIATSDHLFVLINYQTAEIGLSIDPATLRTETDSLNVIIYNPYP
jgi:hypothetical protein